MKKIILTLLILMVSSPCYASMMGVAGLRRTVPPTLTASGTVTKANTKISSVDGTAFLDLGATINIATYAEGASYYMVVLRDSSNRRLIAMIKDAGTGETTTDVIGGATPGLLNGDFETGDPPATWTHTGTTFTRQADPRTDSAGSYSGQLIGAAFAGMRNAALTIGTLYKFDWWGKISAGSLQISGGGGVWTSTSSSTWENVTGYGTCGATNTTLLLGVTSSAATASADDVIVQSVDTPSVTGVTLVSSKGGTTYNVFSKQASHSVISANYTYEIRKY